MAWLDSQPFGQSAEIGTVDADPSAGAGLAAAVGSIAVLSTGLGVWRKSGAADTDWRDLSGTTVDTTPAFPTVNSDTTHGFRVGDRWTVDGGGGTTITLRCKDDSAAAAVWEIESTASVKAGYPDANEDAADGHGIASMYFDSTNQGLHLCSDPTAAAAVWHQVGAYGDRDYCCNGSFRATYDFATHGGAVGTRPFGPFLPDNCYVQHAHYEVATTFQSATDAATIAIGHADDVPGMVVAIAISDVSNPWDAAAGPVLTLADNTLANFLTKTTAKRQIALTVAGGEDLTAGRLTVWGTYAVAE